MPSNLDRQLELLRNSPALLSGISSLQRGLEKESLRVNADGSLALTPHPPALGSPLSHPKITTDYSEALLEFITPVASSIADCLQQLQDIQLYTYHSIKQQGEMLWTSSMPCKLGKADAIPVARYGKSNVGKMKTVYRLGLGHRYGRPMQTISGIHYNFSLSDKFWAKYQQVNADTQSLADFKTEQYFGLMRNFRRYVPLFVYLFGASPALCKSFLNGQQHQLQSLDDCTLYGEFATSLRMGDLGYQSSAQSSLFVCYNSLNDYIHSLRRAITEPHADYQKIGLKDEQGNYKQLNTALLQIENEFYSTIRPKRLTASGEAPVNALARGGVEYIEVRCVDVNPFTPLGIDEESMQFLDVFLLYCLLRESSPLDDKACTAADDNFKLVVNQGRKPDLAINIDGHKTAFRDWADALLKAMQPLAQLLDTLNASGCYQQTLSCQQKKIRNASLTPSAQVLAMMHERQCSYAEFACQQSRQWQAHFLSQPLSEEKVRFFAGLAADSLVQQQTIEAADTLSFDEYLAHFYQQYTVKTS